MSGYTLDGKPVDDKLPEGWGASERRVGRVGDWNAAGQERPPNSPEREGAELYAGGERSGLAVQNPDEPGAPRGGLVENILSQAARSGPPSASSSPVPWGAGHTLGSNDAPGASAPEAEEVQRRTLTFWRDGFSIEDGPLHAYGAPGSKELLEAIEAGRAPVSLFGVRFGQPLEVVVNERRGEDYTPAPKVLTAFGGGGNRLGNVVPDIAGTPAGDHNRAVRQDQLREAAIATAQPAVDEGKPSTSVQLRLANGEKKVVRVNTDATVAQLRELAEPAAHGRAFVLQTTFPPRQLGDGETIDGARLANSVVVQRLV